MKLLDLLSDPNFVAALLNGPCIPGDFNGPCSPIRPEWIDMDLSAATTLKYQQLLPYALPYHTCVQVERNPNTLYEDACVDAEDKRQRYFVISVVPDTDYPFSSSYPLHLFCAMSCLHFWDLSRACLEASKQQLKTVISTKPVPPILNNARIFWVTLYLGRKPFNGITQLSKQWLDYNEYDGLDFDIRLFDLRKMEPSPLLQRLIDAYDSGYHGEQHD